MIALTNSESHKGHFALILEDIEIKKRLSVTIGPAEAQSIAMVVEKMKSKRPQTHDLFVQTLTALNARLIEVVITKVIENTYYAELVIETDGERVSIDSRTSDAIALAVRQECPIYTYQHILEETGFTVDQEGLPIEKRGSFLNFPLNELEELLEKVLKKEDYESASRIRDAISKKKTS